MKCLRSQAVLTFARLFTVVLVVALLPLGTLATDLENINRLIDNGRFDDAVAALQNYGTRIDCDIDCQSEVSFLTGFCRFRQGYSEAALEYVKESVALNPKRSLSEAEYPEGFIELFERARSKVLCSIEIRVVSPTTVAIQSRRQISTLFRATDVPATSIVLNENRYGRAQRYWLLPGQLNIFDLELQELHDYHAFDSLHLSLRPVVKETGRGEVADAAEVEDDVSPCVDIGAYCVELMPSNYYPGDLSQIVIEGERSSLRISVLMARPEWTKLHRDLESNPKRRTLAKVLKYSGIAGSILTAAWAVKANSDADKKYDSYLTKIDPTEISNTYREYTDLLNKRDLLSVFSMCFAATTILSQVFSPRNEMELIEDFEAKHRKSGIALDVKRDYVGLKLSLNL